MMDAYRIKACGIALSWRDLEESIPAIWIDDLMMIAEKLRPAKPSKRSPRRGR